MKSRLYQKIDLINSSQPVFWFFILLLVLPIWLVQYPPMVDLPGHASQIQLMHDLRADDFLYADLFQRYYLTPYWGGYMPVYLLSFIFGVLGALKITITLALVGIPFFTKKIISRFGGNPAWVWLCFPAAYSNPFYWGFLNYILTVAIGLGWVYFCIKVADKDKPGLQAQLMIALGVIILFFGHLIACGMLGLTVGIYYLFLNKTIRQRFVLLAPLLIFIPLAGAFFWLEMSNDTGLKAPLNLNYQPERYKHSLSLLVGRTTWWSDFAGLMLLVTPFITGGALTHRLSRLLPFVIILVFVLLLPEQMMGTYLIYPRFFIFVLPLLFIAMEYRPGSTVMLRNLLPIMIAMIVMSLNTRDFLAFEAEHEDFNRVIEQADPDSRIFKIVFSNVPTVGDLMLPIYDHFPSWHHLRGKGLVDFNFASFGNLPVSYKDIRMTKVPRFGFSWAHHRGDCYNYFISRANVDPFSAPHGVLRSYRDKVELVISSGNWFLHENKNPIICNL